MKAMIAAIVFIAVSMTLPASVEADSGELTPDLNGFVVLQPGEETWQEIPGLDGVSYMKVYGDSSQPGVYVVRVRFQPWTMTMPHVHSQERLVKGPGMPGQTRSSTRQIPHRSVPAAICFIQQTACTSTVPGMKKSCCRSPAPAP